VHHKGTPDYDLAARLAASLDAPVMLSGGLRTPEAVAAAYERTGVAAVMLARGALGNPWLFEQVLGVRAGTPGADEVLGELDWVMDRAVEHLGPGRAGRYLRKFYPWYVVRLALPTSAAKRLREALQRTSAVTEARALLGGPRTVAAAA
jgi:tRNA-dihydrouridine synthase B